MPLRKLAASLAENPGFSCDCALAVDRTFLRTFCPPHGKYWFPLNRKGIGVDEFTAPLAIPSAVGG